MTDSYYSTPETASEVHALELYDDSYERTETVLHVPEGKEEKICSRCKGLGDDPKFPGSDCTACFGWGSVYV